MHSYTWHDLCIACRICFTAVPRNSNVYSKRKSTLHCLIFPIYVAVVFQVEFHVSLAWKALGKVCFLMSECSDVLNARATQLKWKFCICRRRSFPFYVASSCLMRCPLSGACNLSYRIPRFFPVYFHNLSGYDAHLFIKKLGVSEVENNCIPNKFQLLHKLFLSVSFCLLLGMLKCLNPRRYLTQ